MKFIKLEITRRQYEKAMWTSPYRLIPDQIKMGKGAYDAAISTYDGKYFLSYGIGDGNDEEEERD